MIAAMKASISSSAILILTCLAPCLAADTAEPGKPREVTFTAALDGSTQRYVEMLPKEYKPGETYHLLLVLHGAGGDGWEYFRHPNPQCKATRDLAAAHQIVMVGPDYRGGGSWMNAAAEADVVQIIREVRARYKIGKVIVAGASMGGASSLTFTALHPDLVDGLVSQCGRIDLEELNKRGMKALPEKVFSMPTALWTGGKDTAVPPQSVMRLAEKLKESNPKLLHLHRPNWGHTPNYEDTIEVHEFVFKHVFGTDKK